MNILFYLHQFPGFGGIETVTATLAAEFTRRGHKVYVLSHRVGLETSEMTDLPKSVGYGTMPDIRHLYSKCNQSFVRNFVEKNKIDVILFQDSYAKIERNVLGCEMPCKVVTIEHNAPFYCITGEFPNHFTLLRRFLRAVRHFRFRLPYYYEGRRKRFLYDKSSRYILLSHRFRGEFNAMAKLWDCRKLRALPNPIAPALIPGTVDFEAKENLILFVGTLNGRKSPLRALEALKILKDKSLFPNGWRFEILGDGPDRDKCERFILDNAFDFAKIYGYVKSPLPFFKRAKLILLPSSREGFPGVLIEAQTNGCVPVVFSSYSSIFDIVQDNENGIVVDAFDIDKYAEAIHSLVVDDAKWKLMARRASKVADRYSPAKIADRWESLFAEVIRK